jgi:peptidoglycan/xylan/chitin deacetylase (PgdA/CDA1 family)
MFSNSLKFIPTLYLLFILFTSYFLGLFSTVIASSNGTCLCIAFRLDDVQDYFLDNVQMEIVRTFQDSGTSITMGIIGHNFGNDTVLISFMNQTLHKATRNNLEIANHGWDHENFTEYSSDDQYQRMKKTNDKIDKLLSVNITGFLAPYNQIDYGTVLAAEKNQMNYISSDLTSYNTLTRETNVTNHLIRGVALLPETLSVGALNQTENNWELISNSEIINKIEYSLKTFGMAIITLHPMNYAIKVGLDLENRINGSRINDLEVLLKDISKQGWKVGTMENMAKFYASNLNLAK